VTPPASQLVRDMVWAPLAHGGPAPVAAVATPETANDAVGALFGRLVRFIGTTHELLTSRDPFPWAALERLVQEAADELVRSDDLFWLAHRALSPTNGDYLALHQARVAVMALRLGRGLGYEGRRLGELGMAACLFDVGLWELPDGVVRQADPLSPRAQDSYRSHPQLSAAIVRRWGPPSDVIVEAVLEHHEREQGQGYPQGLKGPAVHPDAKIIGLADTYATLTTPPPQRVGRPAHEAIREIVRSRSRAFDPVLIKALLAETSLFPPGTLVRLSSGEIGRVLELNRQHPLRPRIEVRATPPAVPHVIDLVDAPFVYITGPIAK
jgi:HD-GYP domain-containing protein (c-di-GMP phosphodiesterase class II)